MTTVVGLVAEGMHDFPVVQAFLNVELPLSFTRPIEVRHLQPSPDASTGDYGGGGYGRVVGWCKAHAGSQIETFFTPLEEDEQACDLIVVQLDGDAMAPCSIHTAIPTPTEPCSAKERLDCLTAMTTDWLAPIAARAAQIRLAFPIMHSEAWLLAALKPHEQPWEQLQDTKAPFRALRPKAPKISVRSFYEQKAAEAAEKADLVAAQSESYSAFRKEITSL